MSTAAWLSKLGEFAPEFLATSSHFRWLPERPDLLLHGSSCRGIDDAVSDLDVWLILPARQMTQSDEPRHVDFTLDGKAGHFSLVSREDLNMALERCDMETISEMKIARSIGCPSSETQILLDRAATPMRPEVREAWFCYHYVMHRSDHRAADNPIERGDAMALLLGVATSLEHALRCLCLLDNQPYPYRKWLGREAIASPTGERAAQPVKELLDHLSSGALQIGGPEKSHPLSGSLRQIRKVLIDSARLMNIDEPWLTEWWHHLDAARVGIRHHRW